MVITNFQVQNTLRAYGQQMTDRGRFSKAKAIKTAFPKDEVSFSAESKKKLMVDRIAREMVTQFRQGPELNENGREILRTLSREYGQPLTLEWKDGEGPTFLVADGGAAQAAKNISPEENQRLNARLLDIAQSIVYSNLG